MPSWLFVPHGKFSQSEPGNCFVQLLQCWGCQLMWANCMHTAHDSEGWESTHHGRGAGGGAFKDSILNLPSFLSTIWGRIHNERQLFKGYKYPIQSWNSARRVHNNLIFIKIHLLYIATVTYLAVYSLCCNNYIVTLWFLLHTQIENKEPASYPEWGAIWVEAGNSSPVYLASCHMSSHEGAHSDLSKLC